MTNTANQAEYTEIDLIELAFVLWKKIWILILCFAIGFGGAGAYSQFFITPLYQSTATIYIFSKSTSITSVADIQLGSQLTVDFQLIAETREVMEQAIQELNLNMTPETLRRHISVTNPDGSHMLKITVTNSDPQRAADISNTIANILRNQVAVIMDTDVPSMVEKAIPATQKSSPSVSRNAIIGGLAGVALAAGVIIVSYMLDDTIKTDEDVKKYLELEVLAAIPFDPTIHKEEEKRKKKKSKGQKHSKMPAIGGKKAVAK